MLKVCKTCSTAMISTFKSRNSCNFSPMWPGVKDKQQAKSLYKPEKPPGPVPAIGMRGTSVVAGLAGSSNQTYSDLVGKLSNSGTIKSLLSQVLTDQ